MVAKFVSTVVDTKINRNDINKTIKSFIKSQMVIDRKFLNNGNSKQINAIKFPKQDKCAAFHMHFIQKIVLAIKADTAKPVDMKKKYPQDRFDC